MTPSTVLDSWAVLHLLDGGRKSATVDRAIDDGAAMSWVNLGEVDYVVRRRLGAGAADEVVGDIRARVQVELPDVRMFRAAAQIIAAVAMAYADAFAAALSARYDIPVLTGDPELLGEPPPGVPRWTTVDLR